MVFKTALMEFNIDMFIYFFTFLIIVANLFEFIFKGKIKSSISSVFILLIYSIFQLALTSIYNNVMYSLFSYMAVFLYILFWVLIINNQSSSLNYSLMKGYFKLNIVLGIVSSILAIYQYYFDPSIFNLVVHNVYGNEEILLQGNVLRRTTALIGSPQSFSLYMGMVFGIVLFTKFPRKSIKLILLAVLFIGGILSGSRMFTVFIVILFLGYLFENRNRLVKFLKPTYFILFGGIITLPFLELENNNTVIRLLDFIGNWPALMIFFENFKFDSFYNVIFGHGLGYKDRIVYNFFGYEYQSVESYILLLLLQQGIVGLVLFINIYTRAFYNSILKNRFVLYLLIAFLVNQLFVPAFSGLTFGFLGWGIIIYALSINRDYKDDPKTLE